MKARSIWLFGAGILLSSYILAAGGLLLLLLNEPSGTLSENIDSFLTEDFWVPAALLSLPGILISAGTASSLTWHPKAMEAYQRLRTFKANSKLFWFVFGLIIPQACAVLLVFVALASWLLAYFFPERGALISLCLFAVLAMILLEETPPIVIRLVARVVEAHKRPMGI
jgi:hypothetical protein